MEQTEGGIKVTNTTKLKLELPSGQDPPDIEVINRNMEKLDKAIGQTVTGIETFEEG